MEASLFKAISELWPPQKLRRSSPLFYSGQVPNISFLLFSGELIFSQNEEDQLIQSRCLVGVRELFFEQPSVATVVAKQDAEICFFDRQALLNVTSARSGFEKQILEVIHSRGQN